MQLPKWALLSFICFIHAGVINQSAIAEPPHVAEPLQPWIEWVSDLHPELRCANLEGSNACVWPGKLEIEATNSGAHFRFVAHVDYESVLSLPGTDTALAHGVEIKPLSIGALGYVQSGESPTIKLNRGDFEITGNLSWQELPETLNIPPQAGLVRLIRDGKLIDRPTIEGSTLWLGGVADKPVREADALSISSVRNVTDGAPFVIETALRLRVAGSARQLALPNFLPSGFTIVAIDSDLGYQVTQQGQISLQLIAGEHTVKVTAQSASAPTSLAFPQVQLNEWPAQEYISWRPDPSFRTAAVSGGVLTDASRTELPPEWQQGSIYALTPGEAISIVEQARGEQEPQITKISLQRDVWLHADGSGFTATDTLRGFAAAPWRLDLQKNFRLGQASVDGLPQVVTSNPNGGFSGVELRSTDLNMNATFVSEQAAQIPANGWTREVDSAQVSVHLPNGWRALTALGADSVSDTIVSSWSLTDLMIALLLVCISAVLFGRYGAFAMAVLSLAFHGGTGEMRATWIALSIGCLGLRYLPQGRLRILARIYTALIVMCLLVLAPAILSRLAELFVPNASAAVSNLSSHGLTGLAYSLLERQPHLLAIFATIAWAIVLLIVSKASRRLRISLALGGVAIFLAGSFLFSSITGTMNYRIDSKLESGYGEPVPQAIPAPARATSERFNQAYDSAMQMADGERGVERDRLLEQKSVVGDLATSGSGAGTLSKQRVAFQELDPRAVVQTGPGVPINHGPVIKLRWNNKVAPDQDVRLIYLPPMVSSLLTLFGVVGIAIIWIKAYRAVRNTAWLSVVLLLFAGVNVRAQSFPSSELLNELQQRILNARCVQNCVAIDNVKFRLDGEHVQIYMRVSSQGVGAVALPGPSSELIVSDVKIGSVPSTALLRTENDVVFARVPDGVSQLEISANFVDPDEAAITFSQQPHFVTVDASGWQVDGLSPEGMVRGNLHLVRSAGGSQQQQEGGKRSGAKLPQWYTIDRSLRVGLNWLVSTTVTRSTGGLGAAGSVQIPLLEGEAILTPGLNVTSGQVEIPFAYGEDSFTYESKLPSTEALLLKATTIANTTEAWSVACGTIWQCTASGLNPIYSQSGVAQEWRWRPFPGEEVRLSFAKPLGVDGQTTTLDSINLEVTPDLRSTAISLRANVRQSQAGLFSVQLPQELTPEKLMISGTSQIIRRESNRIILTLPAGASQIELHASAKSGWHTMLTTPEIKLGDTAVNLSTKIVPSSDRWNVFAGGEGAGPVMLWWGKLALLISFAVLLLKRCKIDLPALHVAILMFGFAILSTEMAIWPFVWLALLAWRSESKVSNRWSVIASQLAIVIASILALWACWNCLSSGLHRPPDMLIANGGVSATDLIWSVQRSAGSPPQAWLISVPRALWQAIFVAWIGLASLILLRRRGWISSRLRSFRLAPSAS